jgi:hypothetical protein
MGYAPPLAAVHHSLVLAANDVNDTIWLKELAFPKAALIRKGTTIALVLSALALVVVWIGVPGLLIATKGLPGQHPQLSKEMAVSVYSVALALGVGIPYAFMAAVITIRSPKIGISSDRYRAKLILLLTLLVYLDLLALSVVNFACDVSADVFADTWRLLTPTLLLGWVGIVLLQARLIVWLRNWLARPRIPDPSHGREISPSLTRRFFYQRAGGAVVVFAACALIAQSLFAVGAILLLMGMYLIAVPRPKRFAPTWTQQPRVRAIAITARIGFSGLLLIIGSYAYGYSIMMAALTTTCFFDESALGKFHFDVSPIALVIYFGLVFSPLVLIGTGYFVLGLKLVRSSWGDASDLLFLVGIGSILIGFPIALLTQEDLEFRPFFVGGILLTACAMIVADPSTDELAGIQ